MRICTPRGYIDVAWKGVSFSKTPLTTRLNAVRSAIGEPQLLNGESIRDGIERRRRRVRSRSPDQERTVSISARQGEDTCRDRSDGAARHTKRREPARTHSQIEFATERVQSDGSILSLPTLTSFHSLSGAVTVTNVSFRGNGHCRLAAEE